MIRQLGKHLLFWMHFNGEGGLVAATKTINFNPVQLQETEAAGVQKHCALLVEIANSKYNLNLGKQ